MKFKLFCNKSGGTKGIPFIVKYTGMRRFLTWDRDLRKENKPSGNLPAIIFIKLRNKTTETERTSTGKVKVRIPFHYLSILTISFHWIRDGALFRLFKNHSEFFSLREIVFRPTVE